MSDRDERVKLRAEKLRAQKKPRRDVNSDQAKRIQDYVDKWVAEAPPLTERQKDTISAIFRSSRGAY